jgi:hypothetical protein
LHATLDRYVNAVAPAGTRYFPLGDRVIACFAAMDKVVSSNPLLGSMREVDVAFFVPVVRFTGIIPDQIVFFAPYLFVDIPQAAASGREVHGYRKDFATSVSMQNIYAPAWVANAADLTHVEAWAVAGPGARLQRTRLIDVTSPPPAAPSLWPDADSVLGEIFEELLGGLHLVTGAMTAILGNHPSLVDALLKPVLSGLFKLVLGANEVSVPILFLRQFRDPCHSQQADVQSLVVAKTRLPLAQLSGGKLPAGHQITFHDTASHPFSTELGIASGVPAPSSLTIHAHCGFTLEDAI